MLADATYERTEHQWNATDGGRLQTSVVDAALLPNERVVIDDGAVGRLVASGASDVARVDTHVTDCVLQRPPPRAQIL